jgi:uncharacterized membrane protein
MKRVCTADFFPKPLWWWLITILIALGILFRLANLDQPVYWVDEVATSMRVAGYTHQEVTQHIATGLPLSPADLLQFQQIRSDRPWTDLLRVFANSPEHAPLYFVLMRLWATRFGSSVTAMRSLSVLFSLLALPVMYGLCRDLFHPMRHRDLMAWMGMGLLAISPFFIAYSQEARPYSLWILLLLWLNQSLWRSLHTNQRRHWIFYSLALILSLYTSLLSLLVMLGQGLAVLFLYPRQCINYVWATGIALLAFAPWLWVVATSWETLQNNTTWMQMPMPLWAMLGVWCYSLAVLFFDVPVAAGMPVVMGIQVIVAIATLAILAYATVYLLNRAPHPSGLFVLMGALSTPLVLLLLDLVRNGQSAATSRYLMPTQLGALIAVTYLFSDISLGHWGHWTTRRTARKSFFSTKSKNKYLYGRAMIAAILSVSILSCMIGLTHTSNYQKSRNLSNPAITHQINQARSPQLIAEATQIQDLISLSYDLNSDVQMYVLPPDASLSRWLLEVVDPQRPTYLFNPSPAMKMAGQDNPTGHLTLVYEPVKLIPGELGLTLWEFCSFSLKLGEL